MRRVFAIIASCIALAACERTFDISKQVGESTIWMSFIPSNDYDTTFFILQATTPLVGQTNPVKTSGESVEVKVNGQSLTMEKSDRSVPDRLQFYATDHVFVPGDKVEVAATVPGTGSADASCVVPEPFPAFSWAARLVRRTEGSQALFVDIDYSDPGEGGYYGAVVCQYTEQESQWMDIDPETGEIHWGEVSHSTSTGFLSPCAMSEAEDLSASSENPVTVSPAYYNTLSGYYNSRQFVQIWSDVSSPTPSDGRRHMTFASRYYATPGRTEYRIGWTESRYRYRLVLYRFSESYYNYLKARYNNESDEFSSMGLSPASFVYTNVRGGAGVCGSYTVIASDWIELDRTD